MWFKSHTGAMEHNGVADVWRGCVAFVIVFGCLCSTTVVSINSVVRIDGEQGLVHKDSEDLDRQAKVLEPVSLLWGIADTTATVGRVFRYHLPSDAFKGSVDRFVVSEAGKDALPDWLQMVSGQNVLQGIPTTKDSGQLYLEVVAYGADGSKANDVFSVFVNPEPPALSSSQPLTFKSSGPDVVRCKRDEPETVATIIIDADLEALPVEHRLSLLENFLSHMGLREEMVSFVTAKGKALDETSALVTGTGDALEPKFSGILLSWLVGCGKVEPDHFPALQKLDDDSGNGVMARTLRHPVVGWRVTNGHLQQQQSMPKRRRRQVHATPTPVVTITPPTATHSAAKIDATDVDAMTRKVVDMASPTFSIQPTPSEPVMPKTMTTEQVPITITTRKRPDIIQPSESSVVTPLITRTESLPTTRPTRIPSPRPPKVKTSTTTTSTTTTTATTTTTTTTPRPPTPAKCSKPDVDKPLQILQFRVGDVIEYTIPDDTFSLCGKPGRNKLKLLLFNDTTTPILHDAWLQFDAKTHTIRGLPLNAVSEHLNLVAMHSESGATTNTPVKITVKQPTGKRSKVTHELSMTIATDYSAFVSNTTAKLDVAKKIVSIYGDENLSNLIVTGISKGSVVYTWSNASLTGSKCPVDDIKQNAQHFVNDDSTLNRRAIEKLKPWVVTKFMTAPVSDCLKDDDFPRYFVDTTKPKFETDKPEVSSTTASPGALPTEPAETVTEKSLPSSTHLLAASTTTETIAKGATASEDDIWINTVVPAVVIVAILLIALLVACILYRKKRKGKMNLEDQNTFVNKGAPVIFPDELDDKPSSKPLLIDSPPAAPPEYPRGHSASPEPRNGHKEHTPPTDEMEMEEETRPLYQPPPPVPSSNAKQARPHMPLYRSQLPEIHP